MSKCKTGQRIAPRVALPMGAMLASLALSQAALASKPSTIKPPSVVTGAATQVSGAGVTLRGTVNPHGTETNCYFQYGTTAAYGAQTPTTAVGNGAAQVKVSQAISGLQLGTTYHYRMVAVTSAGTTLQGQDHTFATKKVPLRLKLAKPLGPVVYGSRLTIEGAASGTSAANRQVVLQSSPFPYLAPFADIAGPVVSNPAGGFAFSIAGLTQNTELRVATLETPPISSTTIAVRVAVRVTLRARPTRRKGYVRFYGTVTPAVVGAPVAFQLVKPGLGPISAGGAVVKRGSSGVARFNSVVFIRHGRGGPYRALVKVPNGKLVSGSSPAVTVRSAPAPARRGRRGHA
jgi:hypothetical protein